MKDWKQEKEQADWREQLRSSPRNARQLAEILGIQPDTPEYTALASVCARYRFRVTPYYLALFDPRDPNDPLRRQCIPDPAELSDSRPYPADPFLETNSQLPPRLVHRYPDRVLLAVTNTCAMYCRHCTRKNTLENMGHATDFSCAIDYIRDRPVIREVLLSGGDPLLLETARLEKLLAALHSIEHVEVIRIGTRVPVVLPMRIDDALADMLAQYHPIWVNTQFNHPRELTPQAVAACRRLTERGIPVSNQSVLLKGVNDDFETMRALCTGLQLHLIRPYYVFLCDPIAGIEHFRTSVESGLVLEKRLSEALGGLAMPRFVADIPGRKAKTPLRDLR